MPPAPFQPVSAAVVEVVDVTPRLRRIVLSGPEVARYLATDGVPNVKLLFPDPDRPDTPEPLPRRDEQGRLVWAEPDQRARVRTYTVRRDDPSAGRMEVEFVRHGDHGLASAWVERVRPGDRLVLVGGGGLSPEPCDWLVMLGDETALPAISRTLELLPPDRRGEVWIEVAEAAERQDLPRPAGVALTWLERDGAPAGSTDLLPAALRSARLADPEGGSVHVWVGAESAVVQDARRHLRDRGHDRRHQLVIGYWHRELDEIRYGKLSDHDRVEGESAHRVRSSRGA